MRLAIVALLSALTFVGSAAPVSIDEDLPAVSRETLSINTVRRGDLVRRLEAYGATRRTDASVEAVLNVPAELVQDMMIGQSALLGVARRLHRGRVSRIQPSGTDYLVSVAMDRTAGALDSNEPVAASIQAEELNDILMVRGIPATLTPGATVSWFKLDSNADYATRVTVRIGKTGVRQAEIFSGLAEGDRVVTMGINVPENVSRVRLR
jgi:HlyD family secretion protein